MSFIFSVADSPLRSRVAQVWAFQNFKSDRITDFSQLLDHRLWGTLPYHTLFTHAPYNKKIDPKRLHQFLKMKSYHVTTYVTDDAWKTKEQSIRAVFLQAFGLAARNNAHFTKRNESLLTYIIPDINADITFNFLPNTHKIPDALHNFSISARVVSEESIELIPPEFTHSLPEKILLNPKFFSFKQDNANVNSVALELLGSLLKSIFELQYLGIELAAETEKYFNALKTTPYENPEYTGPSISLLEMAFIYFYNYYYDASNEFIFKDAVNTNPSSKNSIPCYSSIYGTRSEILCSYCSFSTTR